MLDFEQVSLVQPATLVTIVTESVLKDSIIALLKSLKVKSYTVTEVKGEGRCPRLAAMPDEAEIEAEATAENRVQIQVETSIEIRTIVSSDLSNVILYALKEHQHEFAIVAYRQPVEALGEY